MFRSKSPIGKSFSILIISASIFILTVLAHHIAIEQVNNSWLPSVSTVKLTQDLPLALAQSPSPTISATVSPSPSPNSEQDQKNPQKKSLLGEKNIVILVLAILIAVLAVLFTFLSPIVGTLGGESLLNKARFLSDAFPKVLEGVTVFLIVMVITVLALVGIVESQGALSILSALIGYVLGRKATELEYTKPPGSVDSGANKPTELKIQPSNNQVKFGQKVQIQINPPQEVKVASDPQIGNVKVIDKSTIEYIAPSQADAGTTTQVIIKVSSKDNPSLKPSETTIELIP